MESKDILELQSKAKNAISSIKGLSEYHIFSQEALLETYNVKNIKQYIALDKALNKNKVVECKLNDRQISIMRSFGLGISYDGKKFQLTNHTLYTFLTEHNILPIDCTVIKKGKI